MSFRSPTSSPSPSGSGSGSSSTSTGSPSPLFSSAQSSILGPFSSAQSSPHIPLTFPPPPPIPSQTPRSPHVLRRRSRPAAFVSSHLDTETTSGRSMRSATSTIPLNAPSGPNGGVGSQWNVNSSSDVATATANAVDGNGYITPDTSISATLAPMTSSASASASASGSGQVSTPLTPPSQPHIRPLPRSKSKHRPHSSSKERPLSTHSRASTYVAPAHDVQFRLLRRSGTSQSSFLMVTSYLAEIKERTSTLKEVKRKTTKLKKKRPEGWVNEKEREAVERDRKNERKEKDHAMPKMEKVKEEEDWNEKAKEDGMEGWMGMVVGTKEKVDKGKGKAKEELSRTKSESDAHRGPAQASRTDLSTPSSPPPPLPTTRPTPTATAKPTRTPINLDTPVPSRSNTLSSRGKGKRRSSTKAKTKTRRARRTSTLRPASIISGSRKPRSRSVFSGYFNCLLAFSFPRSLTRRLRSSSSPSSSAAKPPPTPAYPRLPKGPTTPNLLLRGRHFTEKYIPRFPSRQFLGGVHTMQAEVQSQSGHGHGGSQTGHPNGHTGRISGHGSVGAASGPSGARAERDKG